MMRHQVREVSNNSPALWDVLKQKRISLKMRILIVLSMQASLDLLSAKFNEKVDALTTSVDKQHTDSKISSKSLLSLGVMVNNREQHMRNFSVQISGLKMPLESRKSPLPKVSINLPWRLHSR